MKNKILFLVIIISSLSFSQREWEHWNKAEDPYLIAASETKAGDNSSRRSIGSIIVKPVIFLYRFIISDQDGENCPFYPSCSHFYIESVEKTNLFQGTLMFADRFTRDMNFLERRKYPFFKNRKLYDPPDLYTLGRIEYPPTN
jgi:putative component of membrane protein insertase Oxa1/YidC/SpoIIIJ protein YidD